MEILVGKDCVQPEYPEGDLHTAAEATLQLIKSGTPLIYQGMLKADRFVGGPDRLIGKTDESQMLDGVYEPSEIKIANSVQPVYILLACFYAMLLESTQERRPEAASVVLAVKS